MPELLRLHLFRNGDHYEGCNTDVRMGTGQRRMRDGGSDGAGGRGEDDAAIRGTRRSDEWTLLAVCNWRDGGPAVHTFKLRILKLPTSTQMHTGTAQSDRKADGAPQASQELTILHLFEFWNASYSNRVVSLDSLECSQSRVGQVASSSTDAEKNHEIASLSDQSEIDDRDASDSDLSHVGHGAGERPGERQYCVSTDEDIRFPAVPTHSAHLYCLRPLTRDSAQYIGSNLHFTCGNEVKSFRVAQSSPSSRIPRSHESGQFICAIEFHSWAIREAAWNGQIYVYVRLSIESYESLGLKYWYDGFDVSNVLVLSGSTPTCSPPTAVSCVRNDALDVYGFVCRVRVGNSHTSSDVLADEAPLTLGIHFRDT
jgi:hypothetical protein